jgi:hypothetical protein
MIHKHNAPIFARHHLISEQLIPPNPRVRHVLENVERVAVLGRVTPLHVGVGADYQAPELSLLVQQRGAAGAAAKLENGT